MTDPHIELNETEVELIAALADHSSPENETPPRFYIVNQHIGWLKQYILGMDEKNWRDMQLRAERQLESLSEEIDKEEAALGIRAQQPRPFAWVLPGDDTASSEGWIDARIDEQGEFTKPLYAAPPAPAQQMREPPQTTQELFEAHDPFIKMYERHVEMHKKRTHQIKDERRPEPDAWQWRACIDGKWGSWLALDRSVEHFRSTNTFNLENGTYELRPLYAFTSPGCKS